MPEDQQAEPGLTKRAYQEEPRGGTLGSLHTSMTRLTANGQYQQGKVTKGSNHLRTEVWVTPRQAIQATEVLLEKRRLE